MSQPSGCSGESRGQKEAHILQLFVTHCYLEDFHFIKPVFIPFMVIIFSSSRVLTEGSACGYKTRVTKLFYLTRGSAIFWTHLDSHLILKTNGSTDGRKYIYYLHNGDAGCENDKCIGQKLGTTLALRCAPLCTRHKIELMCLSPQHLI